MRRLRRHVAGLLALLCVAAGIVAVLLALDAHTWQSTVTRDDLRFRTLHGHTGLWRPATVLPGDPAGALLGSGTTIAYRRALQDFYFSRMGGNVDTHQDLPTTRALAQAQLETLAQSAPRAADRSRAANLLGVLVVTTPTQNDASAIIQVLKRAAACFQEAIAIDPGNVDAKQNLELVLRLRRPGKGKFGHDARAGYGFGRGRAASPVGSGY